MHQTKFEPESRLPAYHQSREPQWPNLIMFYHISKNTTLSQIIIISSFQLPSASYSKHRNKGCSPGIRSQQPKSLCDIAQTDPKAQLDSWIAGLNVAPCSPSKWDKRNGGNSESHDCESCRVHDCFNLFQHRNVTSYNNETNLFSYWYMLYVNTFCILLL